MKILTMKFLVLTCIVVIIGVAGCASAPKKQFTADSMSQIKAGMTKAEVTNIVGEPRMRSVDNDGNELWQYRKNGQEGKGSKTFMNVVSYGMTAGWASRFQDILSVTFTNSIVAKVTYQENADTGGVGP